jgi:hypothetical protein
MKYEMSYTCLLKLLKNVKGLTVNAEPTDCTSVHKKQGLVFVHVKVLKLLPSLLVSAFTNSVLNNEKQTHSYNYIIHHSLTELSPS